MDVKTTTLIKEQWQRFINDIDIELTALLIANMLLNINYEDGGQEDHDDYLTRQIAERLWRQ